MGENATDTVREIEAVRDRLDDKVDRLQKRLPPAEVVQERLGAIGVAVGAVVAVWFVLRWRELRETRRLRKALMEHVGMR